MRWIIVAPIWACMDQQMGFVEAKGVNVNKSHLYIFRREGSGVKGNQIGGLERDPVSNNGQCYCTDGED